MDPIQMDSFTKSMTNEDAFNVDTLNVDTFKEDISKVHAEYCNCFSNPKRLQILYYLRDGEKSVGEIAEYTHLSQQNISQHLRIMKDRNVVTSRKVAQTVFYKTTNIKFIQACDLILEGLKEELAKQKHFL